MAPAAGENAAAAAPWANLAAPSQAGLPASTNAAEATAKPLFVLAVVAFTWVGQLPEIAPLGPWSAAILHHDDPIPDPAAIGATLLLPVLAAQAGRNVSGAA